MNKTNQSLLACCQELLARAERSYRPLEKLTGRDEAALDAGIVRARAAIAEALGQTPDQKENDEFEAFLMSTLYDPGECPESQPDSGGKPPPF